LKTATLLELDKNDARKKDKVTAGRILYRLRLVD